MVATVPNEELYHNARVDRMRAADGTENAGSGETMSGQEAMTQESRRMDLLLAHLQRHTGIDQRVYENLRSAADALKYEGNQKVKHNERLILAGKMRTVSHRIETLFAA
ncbi:MAG: hypothetical protein PHO20_03540 [Candidatus Peribacteraceae bacterium]|nr:hypothetical protein [Candidatus Peribacteraceae bacterium]MDD5739814.1 hypothetical protein [Candidatus Peribacteraceae bacterium]